MARDLATRSKQTALTSEEKLYPKQDESIIEKSTKSLKKSQKIHQHSLKEMEKMEGINCGSVSLVFFFSFHKSFITQKKREIDNPTQKTPYSMCRYRLGILIEVTVAKSRFNKEYDMANWTEEQ